MQFCKEGYLNNYVTPISEGGKGVCEYLVGIIDEDRAYTDEQAYNALQAHSDPEVVALPIEQVKIILEWMIGKTFNDITIGNVANQIITYVQPEV